MLQPSSPHAPPLSSADGAASSAGRRATQLSDDVIHAFQASSAQQSGVDRSVSGMRAICDELDAVLAASLKELAEIEAMLERPPRSPSPAAQGFRGDLHSGTKEVRIPARKMELPRSASATSTVKVRPRDSSPVKMELTRSASASSTVNRFVLDYVKVRSRESSPRSNMHSDNGHTRGKAASPRPMHRDKSTHSQTETAAPSVISADLPCFGKPGPADRKHVSGKTSKRRKKGSRQRSPGRIGLHASPPAVSKQQYLTRIDLLEEQWAAAARHCARSTIGGAMEAQWAAAARHCARSLRRALV